MTYRTFDGTSQSETIVDGRFSSSGDIALADGTATQGAIYFADDKNTGIYSPSNDSIAFTTAGTASLTLASNNDATLTGNISIEQKSIKVGQVAADDAWTEIYHLQSNGLGHTFETSNATAIVNHQGSSNQAIVLGDSRSTSGNTIFGIAHNDTGSWASAFSIGGNGNSTFTGDVSLGQQLTVSGAEPRLVFTDTDNNPDYTLWANSEQFKISSSTVGSVLTINSSGDATFAGVVTVKNTDGVSVFNLIDSDNDCTHEFATPGNGDLKITVDKNDVASGQEFLIYMRGDDAGDLALKIDHDGHTYLYGGGTDAKLETTGSGATVTGNLLITSQANVTGKVLSQISTSGPGLELKNTNTGNVYTEIVFNSNISGTQNATAALQSKFGSDAEKSKLEFLIRSSNAMATALTLDHDKSATFAGKIDVNQAVGKIGNSNSSATTYIYGDDLRFTNAAISDTHAIIDTVGIKIPASKGVQFSAYDEDTTDGNNISSNTLDDYEEGTWTFGIQYHNGSAWVNGGYDTAPNNTTGSYTKVGRIVHVTIYTGVFNVNADTATKSARISGLPFNNTSAAEQYNVLAIAHGDAFTNSAAAGYVEVNSNTVRAIVPGSIATDTWKDGNVYMMMTGTYITD